MRSYLRSAAMAMLLAPVGAAMAADAPPPPLTAPPPPPATGPSVPPVPPLAATAPAAPVPETPAAPLSPPMPGASPATAPPPVPETPVAAGLPAPLPFSRYARLVTRSPFAPATPVEPVAAQPNFAQQLYVTGLAKEAMGGAEKDVAFISSRDGQSRYTLVSGEPGPEGMTLMKVDWAPEVAKSKVAVRKGAETGVVEFDQALVQRQTGPPEQPQPAMGAPPRPVPMPGAAPRPTVAGRPGTVATPPQTPVDVRRRFRIIHKQ